MEKLYTRNCPQCNEKLVYKVYGYWWVANKKNSHCRACAHKGLYVGEKNPFYGKTHTEDARKKIAAGDKSYAKDPEYRLKRSLAVRGNNNPNYGISNYERWVKKYGKEKADELDINYRTKQSVLNKGSNNPMYGRSTPNGAGNGWSGWYNNWYFRSLYELSYMIDVIENNGLSWRSGETKDLKIKYINWDGAQRTYCADFLIEEKYLVEVKPTKLINSKIVQLKAEAAIKFCQEKGYEYKIESVEKISDSRFIELHNSGVVKLLDKYEAKFQERIKK